MIRSYLISAVRGLVKNKMYTVINVVGLGFGLALCLAVMTYIAYEYSWEDGHAHHDRIYRVEATYTHNDTVSSHARVMGPLGEAILQEAPSVEQVAVFREYRSTKVVINHEEFDAGRMILAGPEFFEVFTVPVRAGVPKAILTRPLTVMISDSAAQLYFPNRNPVGEMITLKSNYPERRFDLEIAGIFETMPRNTQLYCDFIASYATLSSLGVQTESWTELGNDLTYLLLSEDAEPGAVSGAVATVASNRLGEDLSDRFSFRLKPLKDIYFDSFFSGNQGELYPGGEYEIVYMLSAIALFILIQAIANFINLATARSADRAREVGVRKTFGAQRSQLMKQFLSESVLLAMAAMIVGLPFYELFRFGLQSLLPHQELNSIFNSPEMVFGSLALVAITGLLAGVYPAIYLSRFRPIAVLRANSLSRSSKSWLRRGLVVFQFVLAIAFLIITMIFYDQANLVKNFDVGFDRENILVLRFNGDEASKNCALMKDALSGMAGVVAATRSNHTMGTRQSSNWAFYPGPTLNKDSMILAKLYNVDQEFASTFGLEIIQGRYFSPDIATDINQAMIITESGARELGLDSPIGYRMYRRDGFREVIGVVKDFHGSTIDYFYNPISIVTMSDEGRNILSVKIADDNVAGMIAAIDAVWAVTIPNQTFNYSFLDDDIQAGYREIKDQKNFFGVLALITIAIGCLGIFGLVSYAAEQRSKEIGIRRVLGASTSSIVILFGREFLILIGVANLVAWPLAYMWTTELLSGFAFRVDPGIGTYLFGGAMAAALALIVCGYQSWKAANANPVESLKYE